MEQSQSNGGAEECHSSESGWTMYIGSTIDDYDEEVDGIVDYNDRTTTTPQADVEDDESDDSMASDASSGPSHHYGNPWENIEGGYTAMAEDKEHDDKFFFEKNKTRVKQIAERKEEDDKSKAPDQDDDKVRRNFRMGKRK